MHWKVKAVLQKVLSVSSIGDKINHLYGSLHKNYYSKGVSYGFNELLFKLDLIRSHSKLLYKNALEIGTGYFLVQPIILKLLGWEKIMTVDITHDITLTGVKKQLGFLLQDNYLSKIRELSILDTVEFNKIVTKLELSSSLDQVLKVCNIVYIAPYEFEDIQKHGILFDFIFSQVVLEHIPADVLSTLFSYTKKWLHQDGNIVHIVNFTDHFANPGFFGDSNISEFNFLRYSDKYWNFWAGNQIAYTNKLGYPYYYQLCEKNNLKVACFVEQNYKEKKPFDIKKIHPDVISKYNNNVNLNELIKVQRGVFLITHL